MGRGKEAETRSTITKITNTRTTREPRGAPWSDASRVLVKTVGLVMGNRRRGMHTTTSSHIDNASSRFIHLAMRSNVWEIPNKRAKIPRTKGLNCSVNGGSKMDTNGHEQGRNADGRRGVLAGRLIGMLSGVSRSRTLKYVAIPFIITVLVVASVGDALSQTTPGLGTAGSFGASWVARR